MSMTLKHKMQVFFLSGGSGTNEELATKFAVSTGAIRATIGLMRKDNWFIERPVCANGLAVYRLSDQYFSLRAPTTYQVVRRGRPALDENLLTAHGKKIGKKS